MRRFLPLMALLLAGCAQQSGGMPAASPPDAQSVAFSTYLSARFAAGEHDLPQAARYYSRALANDPGNTSLLSLSFFYAITSGDFDAAGKYAQATVVAAPSERSARLALAVIDFKRKDYADARKQLSLSAKGPFTVLTLSLLDAWAAAAQRDEPGVEKALVILNQQSGAENIANFHAALLQDYLGHNSAAEAAYKKALGSGQPTPRVLEAYGRFLERNGRGKDAAAVYHAFVPPFSPAVEPLAAAGAAGDGDPATTVVPPPTDAVTLALPGAADLDGLTLVAGTAGPRLPRSMDVEVSADGAVFETVARRRRRGEREDLRWVNGHPQYVIDHDLIAVPLAGRPVAAIRIRPVESSDPWAVGEVLLHRAGDPRRGLPWDEWMDPGLGWPERRHALLATPRRDREDWYYRLLLASRR